TGDRRRETALGRPGGARAAVHRAAAGRARDAGQGARRRALGRAEAAHRLRPRSRVRSAHPDPRRGDVVDRHRDRAADPEGARAAAARAHQHRDRPPPVDDPEGRPHPRDAQGGDPRAGDAPGAPPAARPLLQALPAAVQGAGARLAPGRRTSAHTVTHTDRLRGPATTPGTSSMNRVPNARAGVQLPGVTAPASTRSRAETAVTAVRRYASGVSRVAVTVAPAAFFTSPQR